MGGRIKLTGLSPKGKNRIKNVFRALGTREWRILKRQGMVPFHHSVGPWFLVEPCSSNPKRKNFMHWIHGVFDPNFKIMED